MVVGELVAESEVRELNEREIMNGGKLIPEFDARGMLVAEQDRGETYAEEQVAAMQAVNSSAAGASELVIGSWEKMPNNHDRELAASVQVEADEGPFIFIYIQYDAILQNSSTSLQTHYPLTTELVNGLEVGSSC